jgi:hypothetical protein
LKSRCFSNQFAVFRTELSRFSLLCGGGKANGTA